MARPDRRGEDHEKRQTTESGHKISHREHNYKDNNDDDGGGGHSLHRHHHRHRNRSRSSSVEVPRYSSRSATSERKESSRKDRAIERNSKLSPHQASSRSSRSGHQTSRRRSRSPKREHRSADRSRSPVRRSNKPLPSQEESYLGREGAPENAVDKPTEKQKRNFKNTGLLAAETNKISVGSASNQKSIVLKYHEPSEARKPPSSEKWILYIFKGASQEPLETIALHTRSCWLLGRETAVADIPTEHPSCSKQHAVFQFRYTAKKDEWGEKKNAVNLYVLDLESAHGTFLNGEKIEAAKYIQCLNGDVVRFGESSREYVILLPPKE